MFDQRLFSAPITGNEVTLIQRSRLDVAQCSRPASTGVPCSTCYPVEQCTDQIVMHTPHATSTGVGALKEPCEIERHHRFSTPKRVHCDHARSLATQHPRYGQGWTSRIRKINAAAGGPWGMKVRRTSAQPVPAACTRSVASSRSHPPSWSRFDQNRPAL